MSAISGAVSRASVWRSRSAASAASRAAWPSRAGAARAAKSACSIKACSAVPISAAERPSLARKAGRSSEVSPALWTMLVTLTLAGTSDRPAAGYRQAKPSRSALTSAGSAGAGGGGAGGSNASVPSGSSRVRTLSVRAKGSCRSPASRRRGPPLGWTSKAARSHPAKEPAWLCSTGPAPAARKAAAFSSGLDVRVMPRGMVRISLSWARVRAT